MFFIREAASMAEFGTYIFGDDGALTIEVDNSDRLSRDMLA